MTINVLYFLSIILLLSAIYTSLTPPPAPPIADTPPPTAQTPPPTRDGTQNTNNLISQTDANSVETKTTSISQTHNIALLAGGAIAFFTFSAITFTITVVFIILVVIYCKRQRRNHSNQSKPDCEIDCKNAIENLHARSDNRDAEVVQSPEPIYSEVPALSTETAVQEEFTINEVYRDLVQGEVIGRKWYEELPFNSVIHNFTEKSISFTEPSKSLPELEINFQRSMFLMKREELEIGEQYASGHFGIVCRATYHTHKGDIPVAVKFLKYGADPDMMLAFMREATTLAQFNHPNILKFIGVLASEHHHQQHQPWMIVTELLQTELKKFLLKLRVSTNSSPSHQPLSVMLHALLLKISQEIAAGMSYLAEKKFIHRDLAARNVLVAKDLSIRVADFGMSREIGSLDGDYYISSGEKVPLQWTAPEAIFFMKYSEKSDVWSFGMTMYEIWSLGDKPWGSASNYEIMQALSSGHILTAPFGCPDAVYQAMLRTWITDETARPTFNELKAILSYVNFPFIHDLSEVQ